MATMINGGTEDPNTAVNAKRLKALRVVTRTLWTTVSSTTFAVGAAVGATLMYAGLRVAQAYLSKHGEQGPDQPF